MHTVTWGCRRAILKALKQKMKERLGGAIRDLNDLNWYQKDQWKILQRLIEVSKSDWKYFRFWAKTRFSRFQPYLKSHLSSKIFKSTYGLASRPRRGAVESFTDHFDTNNDHLNHKLRPLAVPRFFAWAPKKIALLNPHVTVRT